jgi:hypothetical protein
MRELPELAEVKAAWLNQPDEEVPVDVEHIHGRRTWELFSTTRSEILSSIGAALFFASVMAWRFGSERDRLVPFGCIGVVVWATVTLLRFRNSIRPNTPRPEALARTGLEHYRAELLRRRDHLRSAWIWHGPLLLACTLSAAALANRIVPGRLWDALPVVLLLAVWATFGIKRRLSQAAELQSEIDEISRASSMEDKA